MWLNWYTAAVELEFVSVDFCHRSRVLKTRDASFQNPYKHALTYYILAPYYISLQIPSLEGSYSISLIYFFCTFTFHVTFTVFGVLFLGAL